MDKKIIFGIIFTFILGVFLFSQTQAGIGLMRSTLSLSQPLNAERLQVAQDNNIDDIQVSQGTCDENQCKYHAYAPNVVDSDFYIPLNHEVIDDQASATETQKAQQEFLDNIQAGQDQKVDTSQSQQTSGNFRILPFPEPVQPNLTEEQQKEYDAINITIKKTIPYEDYEIEQLKQDKVSEFTQQAINYYADKQDNQNIVPIKTQGTEMVFSTGVGQ